MREDRVPLAWRWFDRVFARWMAARVAPVLVTGLPRGLPADRPVVVCPNHVSWWDGFLVRGLQRELRPAAPLLTVMLDAELRRRPLLRLLGAEGLTPGSPASLRSLVRRLERVRRRRSDAVVAVFPQGRIRPHDARPLGFRPGVRLVARALAPAVVLPVGIRLDFAREPRAVAYLSVGEPLDTEAWDGDPRLLERRVRGELDAIGSFLAEHGEDAPRAWPGPLGRLSRQRRLPAHDPEDWTGPVPPVWPGRN